MAVTIIATPGAADANSYCTAAEADAYHATHAYGSDWTGESDADTKARALITATRVLDEQYTWFGSTTTTTQRLLWPRSTVDDPRGGYLASDAIPDKLKEATAEFARQLLAADRMADNDVESQGIKSLKAGAVELTFEGAAAKVVPDAVAVMLTRLGVLTGGGAAFHSVYRV